MATAASETQRKKLLQNILAIAGLVVLIIILALGLFRVASIFRPWLSSLFLSARDPTSIRITVPSLETASGNAATISWKYDVREDGAFEFLYQCDENLVLKTPGVKGVMNTIPCGTAYHLPSARSSISVTPVLSGAISDSVPILIVFAPSSSSGGRVQGNAVFKVASEAFAIPDSLPATRSADVISSDSLNPPPAGTGKAKTTDLSVQILSSGVIDPVSGNIISRTPASPNDLVAVRFIIQNRGNAPTGPWSFDAHLPTMAANNSYLSPIQASLAPGESVENMLRFTYAVPNGLFTIYVDPSNQVRESNKENNTASTSI